MAAPTPTTRTTPAVAPMKDGFRALITFATNPSVIFWEKGVMPFGLDGGEAINVSNMHNGTWRTFRSRQLKTLTDIRTRVSYHPLVIPQIEALVNVETTITIFFSSGNYAAFYGYLRRFDADEMVEGRQPEATVIITPTNFDPANGVEEGPVVGTA